MRQVPEIKKYLLVGGGRLARHLSHYMGQVGMSFTSWNRNDDSTASLVYHLNSHHYTLLCINDDQIASFCTEFQNEKTHFIHFSGAFSHPDIIGLHPLMSFGTDLYDLNTYTSIHFIGSETEKKFRHIFPLFSNPYSQLNEDQKSLYHGLCVLCGNGTTLIWDLVAQEFERLQLPTSALEPYLKQVTKNILDNKKGRWTGPWYREDQETILRNREALSGSELKNLYLELEKLSHLAGHRYEKYT